MNNETKEKPKGNSPGCLSSLVIYVVAVAIFYFVSTAEVKGGFTEREESDFHIAAVSLTKDTKESKYIALSLTQLRAGKVDLTSVSYLLPEGPIKINISGDLNKVTVLERHPDWQLVEYSYGNSHNSISRYRAFKDHIEPVSYRMTMHMGLFFGAIMLIVPVLIVSTVINAIRNKVARKRKAANAA